MNKKTDKRIRLKKRIKAKIRGSSGRPRLSVFRSNKFIYAQVIDDVSGKVLAQASDLPKRGKVENKTKSTKTERAKEVGRIIAGICKTAKIEKVVFDRNGFKYTGCIKTLADTARESGLKF
ncbi:50S ribosomal protein L18 [Candidatus Nomurabacteria bacterium RIFCSPHIGHO2_02_FULL_41_18]|uniref:Large ribosomal subunit protein uL18 n=1 Tax=Candidatus Nomurabacteria bacterium RIFCSPHIGHO2_02_FULL_41_18 TaxID=1801754 RepID=A0A1F6W5Z7_9BACT|nr:MAG: 50S ribosomal protein L18 [Candidatus Nomurabacteria bacterium RIFCSPHIGHO2_01_FULL_41_71]OGI77333.1 MAG: 50S ribosomal protein L18 [Candidatus Nomurabacteria bacterium RIFCSPHIGHO2_02_FULL_41_18]OGI89731.1 MAG: 50S ribosomal protein L18 [Candidatus Nomurabacteria bacterium RIFCSPLOWO2_01_FULL_41_52b]OGJ00330.1 MAG: 50S ribosomal protein L18 [Candidatus Nomurabacteria bacterium RIFCSPLOWO2_02_FULL_41_9]